MNWRMAKELDEDATSLPLEWKLQGQQQCFVMGVGVVIFAVLVDGRTLKQFEVHRDDKMIDILKAKELELWERIQNGDPPDLDESHRSSLALVKSLNKSVEVGKTVELTTDAGAAMEAYVELGKQISALQKERDAMQAKFLAEMGEAELAIAGDRVVTRSWVKPKDISYTRDGYYSARVRKRRKNEY
jgi:predicted phage-related endonuclease